MPPSRMTICHRALLSVTGPLLLLLLLLPSSVQTGTGASFSSAGGSVGNRDSFAPPIMSFALKWKFRVPGTAVPGRCSSSNVPSLRRAGAGFSCSR